MKGRACAVGLPLLLDPPPARQQAPRGALLRPGAEPCPFSQTRSLAQPGEGARRQERLPPAERPPVEPQTAGLQPLRPRPYSPLRPRCSIRRCPRRCRGLRSLSWPEPRLRCRCWQEPPATRLLPCEPSHDLIKRFLVHAASTYTNAPFMLTSAPPAGLFPFCQPQVPAPAAVGTLAGR